jgi:hypothetical protein
MGDGAKVKADTFVLCGLVFVDNMPDSLRLVGRWATSGSVYGKENNGGPVQTET